MNLSLYLHIPFCVRKCRYCDFPSFDDRGDLLPHYTDALLSELSLRRSTLPDDLSASTLYCGGGTPSLLPVDTVARLIQATIGLYGLAPDAEVTLEVNPGTVSPEKLRGFRAAGVNRLSIGVQSLKDDMLTLLGRIHDAEEARSTVRMARQAGFDNLGIDLILGLPGQSLEQWEETLAEAVRLAPDHISAYGLSVEEDTGLAALIAAGELLLPEEESVARMFELTAEMLPAAGYEQYEISNFARPGAASRHNQAYWRRTPYLGCGAGAHSFLPFPEWGERWRVPADIASYLCQLGEGLLPEADRFCLTRDEAAGETMFLGLRLLQGVAETDFTANFGVSVTEFFPDVNRLLRQGLLLREAGFLKLAPKALLVSNQVFNAFV